jgi:tRNA A-37 threonylcarbamoyl transferase component Bud32
MNYLTIVCISYKYPTITIQEMTDNTSYMFIKENVSLTEYNIHKYVYNLDIVNVPKIYDYDKEKKVLKMQKINNMCISDYYGEKSSDISSELFIKIRNIIKILYDNNIEYPDITGYNFIEKDNKVWIIDFGHATFNPSINENLSDTFILKFINGHNGWNPNFR